MNRARWIVLCLTFAAVTGLFAFALAGREVMVDAPADVPSSTTLRLEVDLAERKLVVVEAGEVTRSYDVTVGKPGHRTPPGSYRITWLEWNPSWTPPSSPWARGRRPVGPGPENPMGRVKMFFRAPAYYIHGTEETEALGGAASHGCVRLANEDVIELAQLVMEHGGERRPASWFTRVINRFRETERVRLTQPVPVTIRG
jgi:murein L,D-transpeptidase YcbB/YkuD